MLILSTTRWRLVVLIHRSLSRTLIVRHHDTMAEVAPAPAPAKSPKKKAPRPKKTGPSVGELIVKSITASKEKKGVSLAALKKALAAGGYDVEKNNARVKVAIKSLVSKGTLVQTKGICTSIQFHLTH